MPTAFLSRAFALPVLFIASPRTFLCPSLRVSAAQPLRHARRTLSFPPSATIMSSKNGAPPFSTPIEDTRIRVLNDLPCPPSPSNSAFVLYWVQTSVRASHSPALEYAAALAAHLSLPLRAAFIFDTTALDGAPLTERHASFLLHTLHSAQAAFLSRKISLAVVSPPADATAAIASIAKGAAAVVTDTSYLRRGIHIRTRGATALARSNTPLVVVEGDVVVPLEVATDKVEYAARTLRPRITKHLGDYIVGLEPVGPGEAQSATFGTRAWLSAAGVETLDVRDVGSALAGLSGLDRGAPKVSPVFFRGGEDEAQRVLATFLKERLGGYAAGRNEPAMSLQSDLSPYLRVGAISPVDIALQTQAFAKTNKSKAVQEGVAGFLEELIVRRELAANMCWFDDDYDVFEKTLPKYALESLELHKPDKRPVIYSYEELEAAVTNDTYWNTAQLELVVTGKQHGYMRMYWAKQIIGWTPDAKTAMDYCIRLNNRWELDAVDPNSYAGVIWNFGRHDQGWKEREIWGKVRFMNESGLKRKFNMPAYISKVARLVKEHGLPSGIEDVRVSKGEGKRGESLAKIAAELGEKKTTKRGSGNTASKSKVASKKRKT